MSRMTALAAGLIVAVSACGADSLELVSSGGFEDIRTSWSLSRECVVDDGVAHSGKRSLRFASDAMRQPILANQRITLRQARSVPVVVSAWSKAAKVTGRGTTIMPSTATSNT